MGKSTAEQPLDPDAYAPRRKLTAGWSGALFPLAFAIAAVVLPAHGSAPVKWAAVGLGLLMAARSLLRHRKTEVPVTIDRPGITFGRWAEADRCFVAWESVVAVVLFEVPRTDTGRNRSRPAIGVRLRGHPDGVSLQRPLDDWTLDRRALEAAVARFGATVVDQVEGDAEREIEGEDRPRRSPSPQAQALALGLAAEMERARMTPRQEWQPQVQ